MLHVLGWLVAFLSVSLEMLSAGCKAPYNYSDTTYSDRRGLVLAESESGTPQQTNIDTNIEEESNVCPDLCDI